LLKWAGGKRWLAPRLLRAVEASFAVEAICEPFVGGGALFFAGGTGRAWLGDANRDLMLAYRTVALQVDEVISGLAQLSIDKETYMQQRSLDPQGPVERTVRLIYLNRTAFGGLWRVNRNGQFNVPFGCKPETKLPEPGQLRAVSTRLRSAELYAADFSITLGSAADYAFIYCDPPYTTAHENNGFVRYNESIFSWNDQRRLAAECNRLAEEGRPIVVSNALHSEIHGMYDADLWQMFEISRPSRVAASPRHRGSCHEVLLVSRRLVGNSGRFADLLSTVAVRAIPIGR
jgi:DNA adenine methylase